MKKVAKILILFIFITLLTGCVEEEKFKYNLNLYNINEVSKATIESSDNKVEISEKTTIKVVYYMFDGKKSNDKVVKPTSSDTTYKVTFSTEKNSRTLYMYQKGKKYYITEEDGGLYESSKEDFEKLEDIMKENDYKYKIDNYKLDDVVSIRISSLGQFDEPLSITDKKNINIIYNIFSNKSSNDQSTSANPENPEVLYHVTFYSTEDLDGPSKDFYIYKRDGKYYIEQSNKGIYSATESEFTIVENFIKTNSESKTEETKTEEKN